MRGRPGAQRLREAWLYAKYKKYTYKEVVNIMSTFRAQPQAGLWRPNGALGYRVPSAQAARPGHGCGNQDLSRQPGSGDAAVPARYEVIYGRHVAIPSAESDADARRWPAPPPHRRRINAHQAR